MNGKQRVEAALSFERPDRTPLYLGFASGFRDEWMATKEPEQPDDPLEYFGSDFLTVSANETPWPSREEVLETSASGVTRRTAWGSVVREKRNAEFRETLQPALSERVDPDTLVFDDPLSDERYQLAGEHAAQFEDHQYVVCKTGGPYIRLTFMRGTENLLVDIAEDPQCVAALAERLTDHLISVGTESIRRFGMGSTGIIVHDDVCTLRGPIISPDSYRRIFLPCIHRMIREYKKAGARRYIQHCDGNVGPLLDFWVDAGIDAINPLELRAGVLPEEIFNTCNRRLAVIGALDNTRILPRGEPAEVIRHARYLADLARHGGLVACAGISNDISVATMQIVRRELVGDQG